MDRLAIRSVPPAGPATLELALDGELDVLNVGKLSDTVAAALAAGRRHLFIDLTGVTWCDAGSLYTLLGMRHAALHAGGGLALTGASDCVHATLDRVRLRGLLPFVERGRRPGGTG
ncbi:STAS domain-containing protein [Streptomyces sp. NPDC050703]|uniref:STAS domain-containing protein n=1 Tax=Streptomyces sp. NPDC050703 TaxID=3157218 RepID=UPI00342C03AA